MSDPGFIFAAFALAWGLTFGYVWILARRNAKLQEQIEALRKRLETSDGGS